ncbi:MAG TPA: hypothetical protein VFT43_01320 [Candidatus Polarisedimenticolia bacterium]|nr:hypothetical protein [Candidatus Polarisedimenticolia bacterium]
MSRAVTKSILAALPLLAVAPGVALAQCAMCSSAASASKVGRGLNISILFMLAILFLTVGGLVLVVVRQARRAHDPRRPVEG